MQVAVKWIYQQVKTRHGVPLEAGQKPTLCFRGRKYMLCVATGHPVRVLKRAASDFDRYRDVLKGNELFKVSDAVDMFERLIKGGEVGTKVSHGVTIGARRLLDRARALLDGRQDVDELNEDEFLNEEEEMGEIIGGVENPAPVVGDGTSTETVTADAAQPQKAKRERKASKKVQSVKKETTKVKAKTNSAKKSNGAAAAKVKGPTPFRPGTKKEKAFLEFKSFAKAYEKLERGAKGEWVEKVAKKVGVEVTTLKSWIGGQFSEALA